MTVQETIKVCKVLLDYGYGDYEMTNECGHSSLDIYPVYIDKDKKKINMEGYECDNSELHNKIKLALSETDREIVNENQQENNSEREKELIDKNAQLLNKGAEIMNENYELKKALAAVIDILRLYL